MRVISGSAGGMKLFAPPGLQTRPTADMVRESFFNSMASAAGGLVNGTFLDLFAGSGAMGIEALSRGAEKAVFVDKSLGAVGCLKRNLEKTRLAEKAEIIKNDSLRALETLANRNYKFDIIYIDPPYGGGLAQKAVDAISRLGLLTKGGVIAAEEDVGSPGLAWGSFEEYKIKIYGRTKIVFLRYGEFGVIE